MNITGGKYKGQIVIAPNENITRPTLSKVRMGVFNTLYSMMGNFEGKSFLDFFGGSGIMGLEALSRGFDDVLVFEKNHCAVQIIKKNYQNLKLIPNLRVGDSLKLIDNVEKVFEVAYLDPPYYGGMYELAFNKLKEKSRIIVAEHSEEIVAEHLTLLKTKNYGGKKVSFFESQILP